MWYFKNVDYKQYYGKDIMVYYKQGNHLEKIKGKLKFISIPYHDIRQDELVISLNDFDNHITILCNSHVENIYLDNTKRTYNNYKYLKSFIEKNTNSDLYTYIYTFLNEDLLEI
jgi:hypothetical protein